MENCVGGCWSREHFDAEASSGSAGTKHVIKNHGRDLGLEDWGSLACCEIVCECCQGRTGKNSSRVPLNCNTGIFNLSAPDIVRNMFKVPSNHLNIKSKAGLMKHNSGH